MPQLVTVAFRDLGRLDALDHFDPQHGYAYVWPWPEVPTVGQWAIAPGMEGPATVVVGAIGASSEAMRYQLKSLTRRIPQTEVDRARAASLAPVHRWLDIARAVAGLQSNVPAQTPIPSGFDPLPPPTDDATIGVETADRCGSIWWHAYKKSEELGRGADEAAAFEAIARRWYRVRDQVNKAAEKARLNQVVASSNPQLAIQSVATRSRSEVEAMTLAGLPMWDWLECAKALSAEDRDDEALALLGALITAAEQEARISGREPAPGYTERAAMIYRKRKDYRSEIAVIERWDRFCPPSRRGPGAAQAKLLERLSKARELAAKAQQT